MSAENEELVRRGWAEMIGQQNLDLADELYAENAMYHGPDGDLSGLDELRGLINGYFTAFPDVSGTIEDIVASGDQAFARVTVRGTHTGPLGDIPPSGRTVELTIMQFVTIQNGRIVEEWEQFNMLALLQQIGAVPAEMAS